MRERYQPDDMIIFYISGFKALREHRGSSVAQIAKWLGVSKRQVKRWESFKEEPSFATIQRWARALDMSVNAKVEQ